MGSSGVFLLSTLRATRGHAAAHRRAPRGRWRGSDSKDCERAEPSNGYYVKIQKRTYDFSHTLPRNFKLLFGDLFHGTVLEKAPGYGATL